MILVYLDNSEPFTGRTWRMKINRIFYFIGCLAFLTCSKSKVETEPPFLASIGEHPVTLDEYQTRFELTPRIYRYGSADDDKKHFLASLIAEKILADLGRKMHLDTTFQLQVLVEQQQKEAIIEALFEREVSDKIVISENELRDAYFKSNQEYLVKYITFGKLDEAQTALAQMKAGGAFDSVALNYLTPGDTIPTKRLKWGEALEKIENAIFKLKQGEVTEPIEVDDQVYLFQMQQKTDQMSHTENDYTQNRSSLEKQLRRRKRSQMFATYLQALLKDTKVTVPGKVFDFVATELEAALEVGSESIQHSQINQNRLMYTSDYERAASRLQDNLDQPFAKFSDGTSWKIREVLKKLWLGPYPLNYESRGKFRASLYHAIRLMIQLERLAEEGNRRDLQNTPYVREQCRIWGDSFLATAVRKALFDTLNVSEEQCRAHYEANRQDYASPGMINIQEILVEDKALAEKLLKRIESGEGIASLARTYSKRELSAKKGGISGYFAAGAWGAVGKAAASAKTGELVGPVKTENNLYSVFMVIDNKPKAPLSFDDARKQVQQDVFAHRQNQALQQYLQRHLKDYQININTAMLDSLPIIDQTGSGMVVLKQHFPGRMIAPAVQPTDRLSEWQAAVYRLYRKNQTK